MALVTVLQCQDFAAHDPARLARIYDKLGQELADRTVSRCLERLAGILEKIQAAIHTDRIDDIGDLACRLRRTAVAIGLTEVGRAAIHVEICANQRDGIALEATIARLERAYDSAIDTIWTVATN